MMNSDDVAARFDARPGYALVDYGEVGLPMFVITAIAIVQEPKVLHAIEEFVLRCSMQGLPSLSDIAGFLGLGKEIIDRTVVPMIQEELITVRRAGGDSEMEVSILPKGKAALTEAGLVRPEERTLSFPYDGLTRKPKFVEQSQLLLPKELKDAGIPEIPALPARGPEVHEVNALEVEDVIALTGRGSRKSGKLLKLKRFDVRQRWFLPAVALVYRGEATNDYRVSFAISGRLSEEHERAFAAADGLKRCQRFARLGKQGAPDLAKLIGADLAKMLPKATANISLNATLTNARVQAADAARRMDQATNRSNKAQAAELVERARADLERIEGQLQLEAVRPLPVYEHPQLLRSAMKTASSRLLILSPWIRRSVVNRAFINDIESLLKKGVVIHIGFGLGEEDTGASSADKEAERDLTRIAKANPNFTFKRLGNTHAKVLIKDNQYFVISSFNWLSFQGDSGRTFREEWGTYVGVAHQVESFYHRLVTRICE